MPARIRASNRELRHLLWLSSGRDHFIDAGVGKDRSGIAGLESMNQAGIPAASVAAMSARIGSGMSTYEHGIISHCNAVARARGVQPGQTAKDACRLCSGPIKRESNGE